MADYKVPIADIKIDTDDWGKTASNVFSGVAGFATLFGIVGAATYAYNRIKNAAGVEGEQSVPGV